MTSPRTNWLLAAVIFAGTPAYAAKSQNEPRQNGAAPVNCSKVQAQRRTDATAKGIPLNEYLSQFQRKNGYPKDAPCAVDDSMALPKPGTTRPATQKPAAPAALTAPPNWGPQPYQPPDVKAEPRFTPPPGREKYRQIEQKQLDAVRERIRGMEAEGKAARRRLLEQNPRIKVFPGVQGR